MKRIYGIVGHPVDKSHSPAMHNAAIKHLGLDAEYRLFDIDPSGSEDLANFCYETDLNEIGGFSVTMPYKLAVMAYMDNYDPAAKIIGAVNTVLNKESKLTGYNTDGLGAMQALREKTEITGKKAFVMGAGGAGRAIAYSLKEFGAEVSIFDRAEKRAKDMADEFEMQVCPIQLARETQFDIIVNATPVGSLPDTEQSLLHAGEIPSGAVVMDIITNPTETQLLKEAKKAGAKTISGERMLLYQAMAQFKIWFGYEAPMEVMEKALYENLQIFNLQF